MIINTTAQFYKTITSTVNFAKSSVSKAVFKLQSIGVVSFDFSTGILWILTTGNWNDAAVYVDAETWID